jgi:hypothetical protein
MGKKSLAGNRWLLSHPGLVNKDIVSGGREEKERKGYDIFDRRRGKKKLVTINMPYDRSPFSEFINQSRTKFTHSNKKFNVIYKYDGVNFFTDHLMPEKNE